MKLYIRILPHKINKQVSGELQDKCLTDFLGHKPEIIRERGKRPYVVNGPWFSVSHSQNVFMMAVSKEHNVAVDVEVMRSNIEFQKIANKFFAEAERKDLTLEKFYELWCMKEATYKYHGGGISFKNCLLASRLSYRKLYISPDIIVILSQ